MTTSSYMKLGNYKQIYITLNPLIPNNLITSFRADDYVEAVSNNELKDTAAALSEISADPKFADSKVCFGGKLCRR